jgi:hypothetical protein
MKKIYCIEQWWKSDGDHFKDGTFWGIMEDPWKIGAFDVVHEFDNEEDFKNELLKIINNGGIIGKVYIKEMSADYETTLHL